MRLTATASLLLALVFPACSTGGEEVERNDASVPVEEAVVEEARQALLALHQASHRAHIETDVAALLENSADELITVSNGQIYRQTREERETFFTGYSMATSTASTRTPSLRSSAFPPMAPWAGSSVGCGRAVRSPVPTACHNCASSSTPASRCTKSTMECGGGSPTSRPWSDRQHPYPRRRGGP